MIFAIHWHESAMDLPVFPIPIPAPTCLPTPSLWVFPVHQPWALVSCIQPLDCVCVFFICFGHLSLAIYVNCKYFLSFCMLPFCCLFLLLCKTFLIWCSPVFSFCFCYLCIWCHIKKITAKICINKFSLMFSPRSVIDLGFTLKFFIHFEWIFMYVIRQGSNSFFCMWLSNFSKRIF